MHISDIPVPLNTKISTFAEPVLGQRGIEALAPIICSIFARWSVIEKKLDQIYTIITDDDAAALLAFGALKGWDRQTSAIVYAAARLDSETANMVRAVLSLVDGPAGKRHELAHGIWAVAEGFDDQLVLLAPSSQAWLGKVIVKSKAARTTRVPIDGDHLFANSRLVGQGHLEAVVIELAQAEQRLEDLMYGYLYPPFADELGTGFADSRSRLADDHPVRLKLRNIEVSARQALRNARRAKAGQ